MGFKNDFLNGILILAILFDLFIFQIIWQRDYKYNIPYMDYTIDRVKYEVLGNRSVEDIVKDINKLFDYYDYELFIGDEYFDNEYNQYEGYSVLKSHEVYIRKRVQNYKLAMTLAHELVHLKYYTTCERFCNYKAWFTLYNSEDDYYINAALYDLSTQIDYVKSVEVIDKLHYDYLYIGNVEKYLR